MQPELMNGLVLAYVGDAVLEVLVRDYLVLKKGLLKPHQLQKNAVHYVSAKAQADFMKAAKKQDWLTEQELGWYRRGRNTHSPRHQKKNVLAHNESSGFEAILGTLHLLGKEDRIAEIFDIYIAYINQDRGEQNEGMDLREKHRP